MRIAIGQINTKIGDFDGNCKKIQRLIDQYTDQVDLIVFSELCLSGYYPKDLIDNPDFIRSQNEALLKIQAYSRNKPMGIILGCICKNINHSENVPKTFFNSLCLVQEGKIVYTYHKRLLPVYNIFDEARHFTPGKEPGIFKFKGKSLGFLICEDGWSGIDEDRYDCDPVLDLEKQNLDLIICINASPSNIGKQEIRRDIFTLIAKRCRSPLVFVNQIGGNDDIVFDGASFLVDAQGNIEGQLPSFQESSGVFEIASPSSSLKLVSGFNPNAVISSLALFYAQTILGLKDYVTKCGFKKIVLGISGGIDSTLTLVLAVKALGHEHVVAIAMPSRYSSTHSLEDTRILCKNQDVQLIIASIEPEFTTALSQFKSVFQESPSGMTEQNMQARIRGRILMEYSNQTGALVLSTGNKSELSVGYTTLYGDMTGGFNVIGDLYKTDVYALAEYYNQLNPQTPIPASILKKIPSAELAFNQKDSDTLPEYNILDPILKLYIEGDLLSAKEKQHCERLIQNVDANLIRRVHQMVNNAEFKRRQAPPIVRVQRRAFGYGRQLPIAAKYP